MSFVEEATLITKDKTSSVIKSINKELLTMRKRADALKSIKMDFNNSVLNKRLQSTTLKFERLAEAAKKAGAATASFKPATPRVPNYAAALQKQMAAQSLASAAKELQGIKSIRTEFDMPGLTAAANETTILLDNVRALKKFSAVKLNVGGSEPKPGIENGSSGVSLNLRPLQTMLHSFLWNLGYTIQSSIIAGFANGTTTTDVAESRLMLQGMSDSQVTMINKAVREIVRDNPQISTPRATALISEMLTTAQGDPVVASQMAKLAAEMIKTQTILGVAPKEAEEQVLGFVKSAETGGFLTDAKTGKYDSAKAEKYFDILTKSAISIGQEFGPKMVSGFLKYAQTSKFPLDERGLIGGFLASEESGTSAGVGLNQAVKQLSGERITKKNLARMKELGLITVTEIDAAKAASMSPEELTFSELFARGAKNEEELRSNFYGWAKNTLIPIMERGGMDPSNPLHVAKFAGSVTSDRTATNALSGAILRSQEVDAIVTKTMALDVSDKRIDQVEAQSLTAGVAAVQAQFESALGAIGNSFEGILLPALNKTADALISLTNFIAGEGEGSSATRSVLAVGGTGLAAYAGGAALKKGLTFLNPLSAAGTVLTTAGTSLNTAAAALLRSAGVNSAASITAGGAAATAGGAAATGWVARTSAFVGAIVRNAMPLLSTATLSGDTPGGGATEIDRLKLERDNALRNLRSIETSYTAEKVRRHEDLKTGQFGSPLPASDKFLKTGFDFSSPEEFARVFNRSADEIAATAKDSGTNAGQEMLSAAPAIGNAIGQAAAAVISGIKLGVRQTTEQRASPAYVPPQRSDTGAMTPF